MLNSHPIQYFAPLYAYLNSAPDLEVTVLYLSDFSIRGGKDAGFGQPVQWNLDLLAGYRSVFVGDAARAREPGGFWSLIAPQVWSELVAQADIGRKAQTNKSSKKPSRFNRKGCNIYSRVATGYGTPNIGQLTVNARPHATSLSLPEPLAPRRAVVGYSSAR